MSEQTFIDEINATIDNLNENLFGPRILYDMCNDKLHPWGNEAQLRDKLCIISRVYEHTLREGFIHFAERKVDGKKYARHRKINVFESIAKILSGNEAYIEFVEKIADMGWSFAFDGSVDDMGHFGESLFAILEFNEILSDAIIAYDVLYHQPTHDRSNNYAFASKFLHFHRPAQFFVHDRDIRNGMMHFRNKNGCRIGETIIDERAKGEVIETPRQVMWFPEAAEVLEGERPFSPKANLVLTMAHQYAFGCYIHAHGDEIDSVKLQHLPSIPLLTAALLSSMRKLKTQEEIEAIANELKPDMPIEEVISYCGDMFEFNQVFAAYSKLNENK